MGGGNLAGEAPSELPTLGKIAPEPPGSASRTSRVPYKADKMELGLRLAAPTCPGHLGVWGAAQGCMELRDRDLSLPHTKVSATKACAMPWSWPQRSGASGQCRSLWPCLLSTVPVRCCAGQALRGSSPGSRAALLGMLQFDCLPPPSAGRFPLPLWFLVQGQLPPLLCCRRPCPTA